jgi:nitrate reductase gamma subunit
MILTAIIHAALLVSLIGIAIRIVRIATMPVNVRWELYPVPDGAVEKACVMISEVLLLKEVRKHNRSLWLWSWLFHVSLYLLISVAGLSLVAPLSGHARDGITSLIAVLSFAAFICGTAGTSGLIVMRLANPRLRPFNSFAALFNLALLLAIFFSGLAHVLLQPAAASIMVAQAGNLLWLNPAPRLHSMAAAHLCLMAFFAAYFPFTQMAHMVLKYFTYHSVRWDDRPAGQLPGHADQMSRYLAYPVSWSAPHIQGGKLGTCWADVVTAKEANKNADER